MVRIYIEGRRSFDGYDDDTIGIVFIFPGVIPWGINGDEGTNKGNRE